MNTANIVVAFCRNVRNLPKLSAGTITAPNGRTLTLEGKIVQERMNNEGVVTQQTMQFADGSRLRYNWSPKHGGGYVPMGA